MQNDVCEPDLKQFIALETRSDKGVPSIVSAGIALRMRVVWTAFDVGMTGPVARIHLVDTRVNECVEEMHKVGDSPSLSVW
jgi:hypothetical protein